MQIQEEVNKGLKRSYLITVAQKDIEEAQVKKAKEIAKTAKIQGFRPGKAPLNIVRQRYAATIENEVLETLIDEGAKKTLKDFSLRPATRPQVDMASEKKEGQGFSFKLELEVLPEIKPVDFSKIALERKVADVEGKTLDEALERIALSTQKAETVKETRPIVKGEIAVIDFEGSLDGTVREDMAAKNHQVKLGSKSLIDTFEEQIEGMKVGGEKKIKVTFPKDYGAADLAGKKAEFKVALKEIKAPIEVEKNDAWAKGLGFPSLEKLRERISDDIAKNYANISRTVLKRDLMDKLAKACAFDLPEAMVEQEFSSIWQQVQKEKAEGKLDAEDAKKSDKALEKEYRDIAMRRVKLGLFLAHVAEENKIVVSPKDLREAMMAEARRYPGQESAVLEYFSKKPGAIERLRAPLLEEKVIDFIVGKAKVSEKKISSDELIKLPDEE